VGELPPIRIGRGGTAISRGLLGIAQEADDSEKRQ
jgi:hypothetical protein